MGRSRTKLVYILAASHSGSTLTAMLLNAHPQMITTGELKLSNISAADDYMCSCRSLLTECDFWSDVARRMQNEGIRFDPFDAHTGLDAIEGAYVQRLLRPLHRGPLLESIRDAMLTMSPKWRKQLPEWQRRNLVLMDSVQSSANARYVVDSSKTAVRLKYLLGIDELDVRVVRLVRDGRAVALTYMDASNYADASDPGLRGGGSGKQVHARLAMADAARLWMRSNQEAEEVLRTVSQDAQLRITYEELCSDTDTVIASINEFLDLPHSDNYKDFRSAPHHVIGNGMRLDSSSEIRLDDRWKEVLSDIELAEFEQVAGGVNAMYGYKSGVASS